MEVGTTRFLAGHHCLCEVLSVGVSLLLHRKCFAIRLYIAT